MPHTWQHLPRPWSQSWEYFTMSEIFHGSKEPVLLVYSERLESLFVAVCHDEKTVLFTSQCKWLMFKVLRKVHSGISKSNLYGVDQYGLMTHCGCGGHFESGHSAAHLASAWRQRADPETPFALGRCPIRKAGNWRTEKVNVLLHRFVPNKALNAGDKKKRGKLCATLWPSWRFRKMKWTDLGKVPRRLSSHFPSVILLGPDGATSLQTHTHKH